MTRDPSDSGLADHVAASRRAARGSLVSGSLVSGSLDSGSLDSGGVVYAVFRLDALSFGGSAQA